jgi:hypothetical protein
MLNINFFLQSAISICIFIGSGRIFTPSPDFAALNPPLPAGEREARATPEWGEGESLIS